MHFSDAITVVLRGFEVLGVTVILVGLLVSAVQGARLLLARRPDDAYRAVRATFGRSVLLGLEVLVAGDIIRTVAVEPTLQNLTTLGVLVLIRTFLSWSLEVEIDGRWPWQRARAGGDTEPL